MKDLSPEGKAISRQVEEAGFEVLNQDLTEILFSPAYVGTPEREHLLQALQSYFGNNATEHGTHAADE